MKVADFGSARTLCNLKMATEADYSDYDVKEERNEDNSDDEEETAMLTSNYESIMTRRVGTLLYSAPEILCRQAYGAAIDVYSSDDNFNSIQFN